jgi:hypothetical protein
MHKKKDLNCQGVENVETVEAVEGVEAVETVDETVEVSVEEAVAEGQL